MPSPTPPAPFSLLYPIDLFAVCEFSKVVTGFKVVLLVIAVRAENLARFLDCDAVLDDWDRLGS